MTMKTLLFLSILFFFLSSERTTEKITTIQEGDILFQTSQSSQSKAIQLATHSAYSHCGMVLQFDGKWYVVEAVQPVKKTLLKSWINRGLNKKYAVRRLNDRAKLLSREQVKNMHQIFSKYENKDYDLAFEWTDDKLYCSELVWKLYAYGAEITLSSLNRLKDFDLSSPEVKQVLEQRYGSKIPLNELVVSPEDLLKSTQLETVIYQ